MGGSVGIVSRSAGIVSGSSGVVGGSAGIVSRNLGAVSGSAAAVGGNSRAAGNFMKEDRTMEYQHGGDIYSQEVDLDFSANLNPFGLPEAVRRLSLIHI